jgi:hypothetical protein
MASYMGQEEICCDDRSPTIRPFEHQLRRVALNQRKLIPFFIVRENLPRLFNRFAAAQASGVSQIELPSPGWTQYSASREVLYTERVC